MGNGEPGDEREMPQGMMDPTGMKAAGQMLLSEMGMAATASGADASKVIEASGTWRATLSVSEIRIQLT
jgi:hypothetical protein